MKLPVGETALGSSASQCPPFVLFRSVTPGSQLRVPVPPFLISKMQTQPYPILTRLL